MKDKIFVQNLIPVCQLVSWREERKKGGYLGQFTEITQKYVYV